MPRVVDHDQRRRDILAATRRVIVRSGLKGTSAREIARESGYSTGAVAHYFGSKSEIILAAHQLVYADVSERIAAALDRHRDDPPLTALAAAMEQAIPLDDVRYHENLVDVGLIGAALYHKELHKTRNLFHYRWIEQLWKPLLQSARDRGDIDSPLDDTELALSLMAFLDGITIQAVMTPETMTPETMSRLLAAYIGQLCASTPTTPRA